MSEANQTVETVEIMVLVARIREARDQAHRAAEARKRIREALDAADESERIAYENLSKAENALLVATGGHDRNWLFGYA